MLSRRSWMVVVSVLTLTGLQSAAHAETAAVPDASFRAQKMAERMKSDLGLSDEQAAKIQGILKEAKTANADQREAWKENRQNSRSEVQARINEVLTDEQRAKREEFLKNRQEHRQDMREKRLEKKQAWKDAGKDKRDWKKHGFDSWGSENHGEWRRDRKNA